MREMSDELDFNKNLIFIKLINKLINKNLKLCSVKDHVKRMR
jgi:hypothetical protein